MLCSDLGQEEEPPCRELPSQETEVGSAGSRAEHGPLDCKWGAERDPRNRLQEEPCTGSSREPLSFLKCYDSVINLLNKLIVQIVFQEECLNYL